MGVKFKIIMEASTEYKEFEDIETLIWFVEKFYDLWEFNILSEEYKEANMINYDVVMRKIKEYGKNPNVTKED